MPDEEFDDVFDEFFEEETWQDLKIEKANDLEDRLYD